MNFKAARCPACGGSLQIPEELDTVKCMYCGGEVIVREAIRLAAGRVREFTVPTRIEKIVDDSAPFPVEQTKNIAYLSVTIFAGLGVLLLLFAGNDFGRILGGTLLIAAGLMAIIQLPKIKKLEEANEAMSKIPPHKQLMGYKGQCPYCDTTITLSPNIPGDDCPACKKRIVIKDAKFHSVDTPVSGLKK